MKTPLGSTLLMAASVAVTPLLHAAPTEWIHPTGGAWSETTHWSAGVPGPANDLVTIAPSSPGTVVVTVEPGTAPEFLGIDRLNLGGAGGETVLRLDRVAAGPFRLSSSVNIGVGGTLEIIDSTLEMDGADSGGGFHLNAGALLLDGGTWRVQSAVARIGRVGSAIATLRSGTATFDWELLVGDLPGSSGNMDLRGATVTVGGGLILGDDPGSTGALSLHAGSLTVLGDNLRIGDDGEGRLEITGGILTSTNVSVGRAAGGSGNLRLTGGTLRSSNFSIGRFAGATGVVDLDGGVLDVGSDTVFVGREGAGELHLQQGEVRAGVVVVRATATATGSLQVSGGRLRTGELRAELPGAELVVHGGALEVGRSVVRTGRPLVIGNGQSPALLRLGAGEHVFADGLVIEAGARLEGEGTVVGPLTVRGTDARTGSVTPPSPPLLRLARTATGLELQFPSEARASYLVEIADVGAAGPWRSLTGALRGTGGVLAVPVPAASPTGLVRVRVSVP